VTKLAPGLLAVVVLLRDEADIFPAFAQHIAALFDIALFLDHGSIDGTSDLIDAACAGRPGWQRWHVAVPGYYQSHFTTFAVRHLFAATQADAVFLLDADEFIDVPDRAALLALLQTCTAPRCVPALAWVNAVPAEERPERLAIGDALLLAPTPSPFRKTIVPRHVFAATNGRLTVHIGNHVIDPGDGVPLTYQTVGTILHVPLRSTAQWARKAIIGALADLANSDRLPHENRHRFDALRRMAQGNLTWNDCLGWASNYGEPGVPVTLQALRAHGFTDRALDMAHSESSVAPPAQPPLGLAAVVASALLAWRPAPGAAVQLDLNGATLTARIVNPRVTSEVEIMRASTSWRVTAPMRALAELCRAVLARRGKAGKKAVLF
jgi:hypothetical protein